MQDSTVFVRVRHLEEADQPAGTAQLRRNGSKRHRHGGAAVRAGRRTLDEEHGRGRVGERYLGHDGVRAIYSDLDDAFGTWAWTIRASRSRRPSGGSGGLRGHGRSSGAQTTLSNGGTAVKLSGRGRIVWQEWFVEDDGWKKALEAVGLSE